MGKRGRPLKFTQALAEEICERIGNGETLQSICDGEGMPATRTVNGWTEKERAAEYGIPETFAADFARARERGHDAIAAECLKIADTPQEGEQTIIKDDGTTETRVGDMLGHRKLQIETRLKLLAKWNPKRYGDKLAVDATHTGGVMVTVAAAGDKDEEL